MMAKYFFHLDQCGSITPDPEGQELTDMEAARAVAIESARSIMCYELSHGHLCFSCSIDITDEQGHLFQKVAFKDVVEVTD
jgi:hypothetical protein